MSIESDIGKKYRSS